MKLVDYFFVGVVGMFILIYAFFEFTPTNIKLHIDKEIGVAFITEAKGNKVYRYDGDEIMFSTGETVSIPKRERRDTRLSFYERRALVMINASDSDRQEEIINQLVEKKYINPENYNVIVLPFDINEKKLKYVYLNYNETERDRLKVKRYKLDLVPLFND